MAVGEDADKVMELLHEVRPTNEERNEHEEHGTTATSDEPSATKCPVMGTAHQAVGSTANQHWWPNQLNLRILRQNTPAGRSHGRVVRLRRGVQEPRLRCPGQGRRCADDPVAGLVAGRLRPLRTVLHPHDVARRRHVPHRRRPWRRRHRRPALRPAQQLARQRQPRQGAPTALADQAEVRPEDLVGRPADLRREPRPGDDGLQDLRLRRRPRGHLGARGGRLLGPGAGVARRRALQRRPGAGESARRRPDGPDLRQSGGPERQPGPDGVGPRHPRDVRPHGDERRGDGRAHRRRPHVRQDPRRSRRRRVRRPRARGRRHRGAGPRLEEQLRQRQGRRHDHERARGRLDQRSRSGGTTATSRTCSGTSGS